MYNSIKNGLLSQYSGIWMCTILFPHNCLDNLTMKNSQDKYFTCHILPARDSNMILKKDA